MHVTGWPYRIRPPGRVRVRSVDVQRVIVHYERGLQRGVLATGELQRDRLAYKAAQRVGVLRVARDVVEVGESGQCGQYRAGAVEHLDFQRVKGGGRGGLGRVDVQPEAERRADAIGRDRHA